MNVLLVHPRDPESFWSFRHVLRLASKKAAFPPLGLLTVAAMLPRDWKLRLVDLNIETLSDDQIVAADYVLMSGMIIHQESARAIARRCAALERPLICGGPLFTSCHQDFPEVPHVVLGEAEDLIDELVADMRNGSVRALYRSDHFPDIRKTPAPRWDLIELGHYSTMPVQFSRGCPYTCEFCDIVVMNGRVPRTKSPQQVVHELDTLKRAGWKDMVFLVDDNFIGHRRHARELIDALIEWRETTRTSIGFLTEASVNLADHPDLYQPMVRAGFKKVFLGVETPSAPSLSECGKKQNCERDLMQAVTTLQRAGLEVMGGFIVGFDSDPPDIFARQFEFIQRAGVVTAMVGLLNALPRTALYHRLVREGRLLAETGGNNTRAALNFVTRLDRDTLIAGYRDLMRRLYAPRHYYQRIRIFLAEFEPQGPQPRLSRSDLLAFMRSLWVLGVRQRGRTQYWRLFWSTLLTSPRKLPTAMQLSILGLHFRRVAESL